MPDSPFDTNAAPANARRRLAGGRGRPARRWQVNPALAKAQPDYRTTGNTGNTGNSGK
jgi:hypothetical protein